MDILRTPDPQGMSHATLTGCKHVDVGSELIRADVDLNAAARRAR